MILNLRECRWNIQKIENEGQKNDSIEEYELMAAGVDCNMRQDNGNLGHHTLEVMKVLLKICRRAAFCTACKQNIQ